MQRFVPVTLAALAIAVAGIANADKLGLGKPSINSEAKERISERDSGRTEAKREMPKNDDYQSIMRRAGGGGSSPACCPADLDCNGIVDASDLANMLSSWGACGGCPADIDQNGQVDASDLATMLGSWGPCAG
jgi:hypothetical protein